MQLAVFYVICFFRFGFLGDRFEAEWPGRSGGRVCRRLHYEMASPLVGRGRQRRRVAASAALKLMRKQKGTNAPDPRRAAVLRFGRRWGELDPFHFRFRIL